MTGLTMLLMAATACGGATAKDDDGLTKSEAQALVESGEASDAVCRANGFTDDGECDDWCPGGDDADCSVSNTACSDGDTKEADDGCNTCTCTDGAWACTEIACTNNGNNSNNGNTGSGGNNGSNNAPSDVLPLEIGECDADTDPLHIDSAKISGDALLVDVGYSGGCEDHVFTACWDGSFMESFPVQARVVLEHDANGDACEAYFEETLTIDLTDMKDGYLSGYQTSEGTIIVRVDDESVDYSF
jgi:hypothetical protein